jgi:hypothetical protein
MRKIPDSIYDALWSYAIEDNDLERRALVLGFLQTQPLGPKPSAPSGRPPLDAQIWIARAIAAALVSVYQRQTCCSLTQAAKRALAGWPHRGLPAPSVDTLLLYRRNFQRRAARLGDRRRLRSTAEDTAASYYSVLSDFPSYSALCNTSDHATALRRLLVQHASDKTPAPKNR